MADEALALSIETMLHRGMSLRLRNVYTHGIIGRRA